MKTDLTITSRGKDYDVELGGDGRFYVTIVHSGVESGSTRIKGRSVAELQTALDKATKAPLDIGFTQLILPRRLGDKTFVRAGAVTGVHATHGSYLVRWADGKTEQLRPYDLQNAIGPLTGAERWDLDQLIAARHAADKAILEFTEAHAIELRKQVDEALQG